MTNNPMKHTIRMAILSSIAIFPFFKAISLPHIPGTFMLFIISASFVFTLHHRTSFPYKMALKSMTCLFQARKKTGTTEDPCLLEDMPNLIKLSMVLQTLWELHHKHHNSWWLSYYILLIS